MSQAALMKKEDVDESFLQAKKDYDFKKEFEKYVKKMNKMQELSKS